MLEIAGIAAFIGVVGLVYHACVVADRLDRSPVPWGALTLIAAIGAALLSWGWLAGSIVSNVELALPAFALITGPPAAAAVVVLGVRRLAPGKPRIQAAVAVRQMGEGGQKWQLTVGDGGIRLLAGDDTERRIAGVDLEQIQADGECLRLRLRSSGEQLMLQVVEFDDLERRRRMCDALAAALGGQPVARARLVTR
jgi:hypothetical protein